MNVIVKPLNQSNNTNNDFWVLLPIFLAAVALLAFGLIQNNLPITLLGALTLLVGGFQIFTQGLSFTYSTGYVVNNISLPYVGFGIIISLTAMYILLTAAYNWARNKQLGR